MCLSWANSNSLYDREADVLYISFKRPQRATDSGMLENGIILRYKGEELVGITVLNASMRQNYSNTYARNQRSSGWGEL